MIATLEAAGKSFRTDLSKPLDISLPLSATPENPIAWYLEQPVISPVVMGDWIGKVNEGKSSTNFNNIFFNPHGHGTHTECLGHITRDFYSIHEALTEFFFLSELITIEPESLGEDRLIKLPQIKSVITSRPDALVIRTTPNDIAKKSRKYSNTNPPYLSEEAAIFLREAGIRHLLIDLPSVDREHDEGKLLAHKAFWNVKNVDEVNADARFGCTITELVYIPDSIADGAYLLNLQVGNFVNDAAPSRPVLYKILES